MDFDSSWVISHLSFSCRPCHTIAAMSIGAAAGAPSCVCKALSALRERDLDTGLCWPQAPAVKKEAKDEELEHILTWSDYV